MINILNLDHLVLTVKDIEGTVKFYEKLGMKKEIFGKNRVALKYSNQKINLHKLGSEFEPKAKNVKEGSADLCFIVEQNLEDIVLYLQKEGIKIEEGIVERTGANGKIKSIYLRDPEGVSIKLCKFKNINLLDRIKKLSSKFFIKGFTNEYIK
ncbi:VOC family protein [Aliarcobacter butzleri]|uniref:VOC family protein n=1 Tax=Aliarcobacter butzleri TaxID=28197 RepID=UPI0021B6D84C|nr:VOC family protein [Aliarcobacter butzleri]MCT7580338.1 VOC family protein [Aliarcobacter butzleri]